MAITARQKYGNARRHAIHRKVLWCLTFNEWEDWWKSTGKYEFRGPFKDQYCMARLKDLGPYRLDNIKCITNSENVKEARTHTKYYSGSDKSTAKSCICDGQYYGSIKEAGDFYNISYQAIVHRIKSDNFPNFNWSN